MYLGELSTYRRFLLVVKWVTSSLSCKRRQPGAALVVALSFILSPGLMPVFLMFLLEHNTAWACFCGLPRSHGRSPLLLAWHQLPRSSKQIWKGLDH